MNLTTKQLKQIIKEELNKLLKENREGGFNPDKEIPDAAPEGFEKTYDSALATMRKETDECSELLEKVIGLCTATTLSIDDGKYKIRVINFNHPSIEYYWSGEPNTNATQIKISKELYDILFYKRKGGVYFSEVLPPTKCYWYPIVDKVKKEVYGEKDPPFFQGSFVKSSFANDEGDSYYEKFFTFTTSLANELRKVQRGEYEHPEAEGDIE